MFDEVSSETGIQYNTVGDCLQGFVDFGGNERRAIYADHALVLILKGIRRRWKQPICFCFCEHSTRTGDLVRTIKDVVRSVHNTGLKIVASISDQGTNNVAAIKYLLNETKAYCLSNNIENRFQGYLVDGNEIVHLYDYPHLLKGIRNSLLVKDLHFEPDGEKKVASWSHILDIYRLDQKMGKFSQFYELTHEHVLPTKIRKMKVKHCTQNYPVPMCAFAWGVSSTPTGGW
nr:unnamed protein product [Callosobruchus chinensis]